MKSEADNTHPGLYLQYPGYYFFYPGYFIKIPGIELFLDNRIVPS